MTLTFSRCLEKGLFCPGEGSSHIKVNGVLVVSLLGVNGRFWSHSGCLAWKVTTFAHFGIA